jgi:hypothetical protein
MATDALAVKATGADTDLVLGTETAAPVPLKDLDRAGVTDLRAQGTAGPYPARQLRDGPILITASFDLRIYHVMRFSPWMEG